MSSLGTSKGVLEMAKFAVCNSSHWSYVFLRQQHSESSEIHGRFAHFQRDIIRGVEGFVSASKKQLEIARKLAENCCKIWTETQSGGSPLARAALQFGTAHGSIENEKKTLLRIFVDQVSEPPRLSITGAPYLRMLVTNRYERLRQEVCSDN